MRARPHDAGPQDSACPHAAVCGGCSLLHLSYRDQITAKVEAISRLFDRPLDGAVVLPVPYETDPPARFRQKVAFAFGPGPGGRGLVMGHHRRGTQQVVPVQECLVHGARANRIAFALRDQLQRAGVTAAGPSLSGVVRHLLIRTTADDREAVAMLVVTRNDKSLRAPVRAWLASTDAPDGCFINLNTDPGPFMVGDRSIRLAGRSHVRERVGDLLYQVSPDAFFQTNTAAAAVLQAHVVASAAGARRVLDLYCGSGLFALPLAAAGAQVTGIEENRQAIADAQANVRLNRLPAGGCRFIAARVEEALRRQARADHVILDPPRQGCSDAVLDGVFQAMRPPAVTYVSCNPQALAAELPGISACGYRLETLRAVDMFPHTDHLEVVAALALAA